MRSAGAPDMDVFLYKGLEPDYSFMVIHPDDWVVIKPNLVKENKETDPNEWVSVLTSAALIESVCTFVCSRLGAHGRVTICDAPQTDSSFSKIAERLDLYGIASRCAARFGVPVDVLDLRQQEWRNVGGVIFDRRDLPGDPVGNVRFNLGRDSLFFGHKGEGRYYGADYDAGEVNRHHQGETQEYLLCGTPIKCDVFINMPKLKTHKKTAVTLSLKNLVGINADKNWLPHHTEGSPRRGGDEFPDESILRTFETGFVKASRRLALRLPYFGPRLARRMRAIGANVFGPGDRTIRSGNWYGNDTTWRMVLDLNRCLLYGNSDGSFRHTSPKRYYSVIDGIVGMEGMGPMQGNPVDSNVIIAGSDPVLTDIVACRVMGFDWKKIPVIYNSFEPRRFALTFHSARDILIKSNIPEWNGSLENLDQQRLYRFEAHFGWRRHVEFEENNDD